ncbi:MAG: arginine--tRNA ligase [Clostridia bacterium]|nr:arginine--tRNA ligase [Clostridia bacterium]
MDYKKLIADKLSKSIELETSQIEDMLEIPAKAEMGDFALPCFKLSKILRKAPTMISDMLSEQFETDNAIEKVQSVNGYLNFYLNKQNASADVLSKILSEGENYSKSAEGKDKTICLDYSSVNIAKPMHIGHLSTTAIGNSLSRIYKHLGYNTVSINHLGDWGTQFGKLIVGYKMYSSKKQVEEGGIAELARIYVQYHVDAENDETMDDDARAWFKKIEDGDAEALELFEYFRALTIEEVSKIYAMLDVKFDSYNGEAFYQDKMQPIIDELEEKGLLVEDQGAKVVMLDKYDMPPCMILKKDGASLYATRDMAAAQYRKDTYDFHKCLYVTAYEQNLHFKQFFKVLELMGKDYSKDLVHVNYGWVRMEDGSMSTRKGTAVELKDLINKAIEKSLNIIEEKNSELENKQEVASIVGIGSIIFAALKNNRIKDMVFSWESALSFEGEAAPYVQYTHARCSSVLTKSDISLDGKTDFSTLDNEDAGKIITLLRDFPEIIKSAAERYEPSFITRFSIDLAKTFNKYYFEHRIIDDDGEEKVRARLILAQCTKQVINTALYLIGVKAPDKM